MNTNLLQPNFNTKFVNETAKQFFHDLYGDDAQGHLVISTIDGDGNIKNYFYSETKTACTDISKTVTNNKLNVYFGTGLRRKQLTGNARGNAADVLLIPGLWHDTDIAGPGHAKENLPASQKEAIDFINSTLSLKPSKIVFTGGGLHAYWLFKEPWILDGEDWEKAGDLIRRFQLTINQRGKEKGWTLDNTGNLAQLLRLPGTFNHKNDPVMVEVIKENHFRYDPSDFEQYLLDVEYEKYTSETISADFPPSDVEKIKASCAWFKHTWNDADILPEPEWYAGLTIIARCEDSNNLAHEYSRTYPKYNERETNKKLAQAETKTGPITCRYVKECFSGYCDDCKEDIKSPCVLGLPTIQYGLRVNYTDLGNAKRLVQSSGNSIRYSHEAKRWYIYNGKFWEPDTTGEIRRQAKKAILNMYREAANISDKDNRNELIKHALKSEADGRIKSMIALAESEPGIPISMNIFNADDYLLNCLNGTLDLRTGQLKEHRWQDYITRLAPVNYNPKAKSQLWENFLERVLPDPETRKFVKKASGYSLTGSIAEEVLFFVYGPAATGKSTFLAAIKATIGDYAATSDFETFLAQNRGGGPRNDIARLAGRRFVVSLEVEDGRRLAENLINHLTGGDEVSARFLHQESFEFLPQFKLWLAANNRPRVTGTDGAIWRRILQIPFDQKIPKNERAPKLKTTLRDPEQSGPAILAWLVEGCLMWQQEGLNPPSSILAATEEYRQDMDPLNDFLKDCCLVAGNAQARNAELWEAYANWCRTNGEKYPLGRKKFSQGLVAHGFDQYHDGKDRVWIGVGLTTSYAAS